MMITILRTNRTERDDGQAASAYKRQQEGAGRKHRVAQIRSTTRPSGGGGRKFGEPGTPCHTRKFRLGGVGAIVRSTS